jgi:MFS transporter, DHA1 family, inner membrane transport protein
MAWAGATFTGAAIAVAVWGFCGWGFVVAQQHRLVNIAPPLAPILLALNASAIYLAISVAGAAGALFIGLTDPHDLPFLTSVVVVASLFPAEMAYRLIRGTTKGKAK